MSYIPLRGCRGIKYTETPKKYKETNARFSNPAAVFR
jgi:hypothetical protein